MKIRQIRMGNKHGRIVIILIVFTMAIEKTPKKRCTLHIIQQIK